jgi:hypothetical protein
MEEVGYSRLTTEDYNRLAAEKMHGRTNPPTGEPIEIVIETECPQCGHKTSDVMPLVAVADFGSRGENSEAEELKRAAGRASGSREITMQCECATQHADGKIGCGAYWKVVARWA